MLNFCSSLTITACFLETVTSSKKIGESTDRPIATSPLSIRNLAPFDGPRWMTTIARSAGPSMIAVIAKRSASLADERRALRALSGEPSTTERSPRWRVLVSSPLLSGLFISLPLHLAFLEVQLQPEADLRVRKERNQAVKSTKNSRFLCGDLTIIIGRE